MVVHESQKLSPPPPQMQSLTGDLSQRSGARAVPLLCVHLPCVGAAPPGISHGAPGPRQRSDRAEQQQQRRTPGETYPGIHPHCRTQTLISGGWVYIKKWMNDWRGEKHAKVRALSQIVSRFPDKCNKRMHADWVFFLFLNHICFHRACPVNLSFLGDAVIQNGSVDGALPSLSIP